MSEKYPISALPLPPRSQRLTQNLISDPETGTSPQSFINILQNSPSVQRKARIIDAAVHFSRLTPLTLPFPYRIQPPKGEDLRSRDAYVENWLSAYEPLDKCDVIPISTSGSGQRLDKFSRDKREMRRDLIALSVSCLSDCIPHLAIGDALAQIGAPSLSKVIVQGGIDSATCSKSELVPDEDKAIREELLDILSGQSVLMSLNENKPELFYTPWSLRFGSQRLTKWIDQLGDGRVISILETPHPSDPELIYELQLKGAGRTPYSRSGDGLATFRDSIKEFLLSEAIHALHIPTIRTLALIHLPDLPVNRDTITAESACILTRIAPSFIRVSSFEALNPPDNYGDSIDNDSDYDKFEDYLAYARRRARLEEMRILGEWVTSNVLRLKLDDNAPWGRALIMESVRRTSKMAAAWHVYGFSHGVTSSDDLSIMGLTLGYESCSFIDEYKLDRSDVHCENAFMHQTSLVPIVDSFLLSSLAPLVGAELESGTRVKPGWADDISKEKLEELRRKGMRIRMELYKECMNTYDKELISLNQKRLGLRTEEVDPEKLINPLRDLMQKYKLDPNLTFRQLCSFRPSLLSPEEDESTEKLLSFILKLAANSHDPKNNDTEQTDEWCSWLSTYAEHIENEVDMGIWCSTNMADEKDESSINASKDAFEIRENEMRRANPRFVLRQWVLEEIIQRVEEDPASGKRALAKIHEMAANPYELWGAEGDERALKELSAEEKEERRICGLGPKK